MAFSRCGNCKKTKGIKVLKNDISSSFSSSAKKKRKNEKIFEPVTPREHSSILQSELLWHHMKTSCNYQIFNYYYV